MIKTIAVFVSVPYPLEITPVALFPAARLSDLHKQLTQGSHDNQCKNNNCCFMAIVSNKIIAASVCVCVMDPFENNTSMIIIQLITLLNSQGGNVQ